MTFKEYKKLNLSQISDEILSYWEDNDIFRKSIEKSNDKNPFIFFEGPPSANGLPGIHHVLARSIKDIFLRYKTMKGYSVQRKAGWDTHGLPVELGVENALGITKEDIGKKITIEDYNNECKKAVMKYTDIWNDLTKKMGYWVDVDNPYITYTPKYMESVWWLLKEIYNKDLMYKGYTIQPYSPKAGTAISSHELNQPGTYQDVTDTTVTAQFKLKKAELPKFLNSDDEIFVLAWTTTPWTLPSNTALTVGAKINYSLIKSFNQYTGLRADYIVAEDLILKQFSGNYYEISDLDEINKYEFDSKKIPFLKVCTFKGKDLENIKYEQLLDYAIPFDNPENAFRIINGDFVTTSDGTGIVHTAPTFGADDAFVAKNAKPPIPPMLVKDESGDLVPLVNLQGKFRPEMGEFSGKFVKNEYYDSKSIPEKSVDIEIAIKLKIENKAFRVEKYKHSYPNCWRTDKPILYYPIDSWFIRASKYRSKMVLLNKKINWKPKSTGEGRFEKWLENVNDWNLSRSRFWGIPLPIWRTDDGAEEVCIGSIKELYKEINKSICAGYMKEHPFEDFEPNNFSNENYSKIDLHKNIVDKIILVSKSGKKMFREADLIDVWFDSGSMPYAQWHYPFENKEYIDKKSFFPADFIAEGVDQTRGWFYTLHAISTLVFDSVSYTNVVSNGLVLDKNGQKMSKRLGNAIDPFKTLSDFGPDATRWYMISNSNPWDNLKFDIEGVDEVKRKFFGTLYNTYSFFALYANIDKFIYSEKEIEFNERPELDRWILSELNSLINNVDKFYNDYEPTKAARAINNFVIDNLSNWYVRLSRRRFWKGEYEKDKISAFQTLYKVLIDISKLSAPISPFFMDRLYVDLTKNINKNYSESIHLEDFPVADNSKIDLKLQQRINYAQTISSLTLSLRAKEKIKVRQPLSKILIPLNNSEEKNIIKSVSEEIKREVNVKSIEFLEGESDLLVKSIKPNFKKLGPTYGKFMKEISSVVNSLDTHSIIELEKTGKIDLLIDKKTITFNIDDFEISSKDIEGWQVANGGNITVALDITINDELRNEGIAREVVSKIQNLRKSEGFEVTDRINLIFNGDDEIQNAINKNLDYVKSETLSNIIQFNVESRGGIDIIFDELKTKIFITKV
ncbi:MAG: isoleucine--tRNA ligase [Flavobacteriaceae bacterium]|nr:isoleucine--tRNA ligase [Flavobacteriaceae bacterium]|tara:strand:+ start:4784 stop:8182 length:3399 start_codon:yes stop_codon:yes gene_type:complete